MKQDKLIVVGQVRSSLILLILLERDLMKRESTISTKNFISPQHKAQFQSYEDDFSLLTQTEAPVERTTDKVLEQSISRTTEVTSYQSAPVKGSSHICGTP